MSTESVIAEVIIPHTKEFDHLVSKQIATFCWCSDEKDGYHFRTALKPTDDLNEHLVWIFMILEHSRKLFRTMTQNGVRVICRCKWKKKKPVILKAKALAMAHLLGIDIEIH
jgi:hypothetical protein